jgi:hypothetical protein
LDGVLAGATNVTKKITDIDNAHTWLGRSPYKGDAWLAGAIDEFRIYDGELDAAQIAANHRHGPDLASPQAAQSQAGVSGRSGLSGSKARSRY